MNVTFVDSSPHTPADRYLNQILSSGTDRVMIACAFCTGPGVELIGRHVNNLRRPGSMLVVSAELPTDIAGVNSLGQLAPGAVWVHKTGAIPRETGVGTAIMHSKVFYAEEGNNAWLWVGSHNLTGRAISGGNLEAAVLIEGDASEPPFVAAREHILACRDEADPCPYPLPELPDGEPIDLVLIHAETSQAPTREFPWNLKIDLQSEEYDWQLDLIPARLYLYPIGGLAHGWKAATPFAAYSGRLTGLNNTEDHPTNSGFPADWNDGDCTIVEQNQMLYFAEAIQPSANVVTQAVAKIVGPDSTLGTFLSAKPKAEVHGRTERRVLCDIDPAWAKYFTRQSVKGGLLHYELQRMGEAGWSIPTGDLKNPELDYLMRNAERRELLVWNSIDRPDRVRHPLILRAKFQLRIQTNGDEQMGEVNEP